MTIKVDETLKQQLFHIAESTRRAVACDTAIVVVSNKDESGPGRICAAGLSGASEHWPKLLRFYISAMIDLVRAAQQLSDTIAPGAIKIVLRNADGGEMPIGGYESVLVAGDVPGGCSGR